MDGVRQRHKKILAALAEYQARGSEDMVPEALERMIGTETDRALVIIIGSFIEDALLERILLELPAGDEHRKALLKGGPLRSVEHRIALGRAMGFLTEHHAALVNVFRAMRNACAHSRLDISFDTPELRNAVALLMPEAIAKTVLDGTNEGTLRGLFVGCAGVVLTWLQGHGRETAEAYAAAATDEQGNIEATKVLVATLLGNRPAPELDSESGL